MNVPVVAAWHAPSEADALLMDAARRIQISRTKHETAERNFLALCAYVDRDGSPLKGKVLECYASGSFATGTAIASRVSKDQHDVDVVIELDIPSNSSPEAVLRELFEAINGEQGSRYYGKVRLNSRCVTVEYDDGTTVDLMPIARLTGEPLRAGNLFHHKRETGESYHKPVNPWGFADDFNRRVEFDPNFYKMFQGRRLLAEGDIAKADTQPMPDHVRLEEKSPRVVALQLIKRARDIAYRHRRGRKPPSIALATVALESGPVQERLIDEVIAIAIQLRRKLEEKSGPRGTTQIFNPAYPPDEFTDRWPEDLAAQNLYDDDLRRLITDLYRLRNDNLSLQEKRDLLKRVFGETAASYAIEKLLDTRRIEAESNRLNLGARGKVLGAGAATVVGTRPTTAAKAATREGGGYLPE